MILVQVDVQPKIEAALEERGYTNIDWEFSYPEVSADKDGKRHTFAVEHDDEWGALWKGFKLEEIV